MADTQARAITALIDYIAALEDRYGAAIRMLADEVEAVNKTASATRQAAELLADEIERTNETAAGVTHALGSVGELFKQKADIGSLESVGKMTMNSLRKTQSDLADLRKQLNELKDIDPTVEMRVEKGMIQYRSKDGWKNLISKEELRGPRGLTGGGGSAPNPGGDTPSTGGAVESVNGKTGKVVLGVDDIPQLRNQLNARVEKEDGKGLIPLDELERLSGLQNYDDTALREELITATAEIAALQENDIETAQQVDALAERLDEVAEQVANVKNYDDTEVRADIAANTAGIATNAENIAGLQTASHTHGNKAVLDSVTQANVDLANALDDAAAVTSQGITMRVPFNADGNAVTGLPNPMNASDAVPFGLLETLRTSIIDSIYPVNSIYISYSHVNPATLFGGTWERINNAFLWACDSNGEIGKTGGEKTHTLTTDEMPAHSHRVASSQLNANAPSFNGYFNASHNSSKANAWYVVSSDTGGDAAHNNMPPYVQVAVWRRTA